MQETRWLLLEAWASGYRQRSTPIQASNTAIAVCLAHLAQHSRLGALGSCI